MLLSTSACIGCTAVVVVVLSQQTVVVVLSQQTVVVVLSQQIVVDPLSGKCCVWGCLEVWN